MSTTQKIGSDIPFVLRFIYKLLKTPAGWLLTATPDSAVKRWFGSDVFARYTSYYTWITNQLGHFTVGAFLYFVAWCFAFLVADNATASCPAQSGGAAFQWALGFGVLFWLLYAVKEVADVVGERPGKKRRFDIDLREAALDGWTDAFFVGFGIVFAHGAAWIMSNVTCDSAFSNYKDFVWLALIVVGVGYAIERGSRFLPQKSRFDASDLPFYFRLTCFYSTHELRGFLWRPSDASPIPLDREGSVEHQIEEVAAGATSSPHVCIFGPGGSGKTALAVGIACNLIIGPRSVLYIAALELIADEPEEGRVRKDEGLLTLNEARWIVVDHVFQSITDRVVERAARLSSHRAERVFIFACDHENADDRDAFVQKVSGKLNAPCLAIHLDGVLARRGSRVAQADAAERAVRPIGTKSPTPA